jgi:hypothetical protein
MSSALHKKSCLNKFQTPRYSAQLKLVANAAGTTLKKWRLLPLPIGTGDSRFPVFGAGIVKRK